MVKKRYALPAWILCAVAVLSTLAGIATDVIAGTKASNHTLLNDITFAPFLIISAVVGAFIISRHPKNIIGWLLMLYPLATSLLSFLDLVAVTPQQAGHLSLAEFLIIWLNGWDWWLLIGPLFLILILFPTGTLPSRRWRWVIVLLAVAFVTFLLIATFSRTLGQDTVEITNPIGIISKGVEGGLLIVFQVILVSTAVLSVATIVLRYRHSQADEREQIKWLVYASGIFLVVYLFVGFFSGDNPVLGSLFNITIIGIPLAIGAAILRYHLYDIDLIINRTLVYVPLTAILAGLYSVTIAVTQKFLVATTGQKSDTALVLTTFLMVATFTPIKNLLQQAVDKRFKEPSSGLKQIHALEKQMSSVIEVLDSHMMVSRLLSTSVSALHATGGAVYLDQGGDLQLAHSTPGWDPDNQKISFPLVRHGKQLGVLCLGPRNPGGDYSTSEKQALQRTTDLAARALSTTSPVFAEI